MTANHPEYASLEHLFAGVSKLFDAVEALYHATQNLPQPEGGHEDTNLPEVVLEKLQSIRASISSTMDVARNNLESIENSPAWLAAYDFISEAQSALASAMTEANPDDDDSDWGAQRVLFLETETLRIAFLSRNKPESEGALQALHLLMQQLAVMLEAYDTARQLLKSIAAARGADRPYTDARLDYETARGSVQRAMDAVKPVLDLVPSGSLTAASLALYESCESAIAEIEQTVPVTFEATWGKLLGVLKTDQV